MRNSSTAADHQNRLDAYFEASSAYWTDVYEFEDVDGTIYRERRSVVLALARKLGLTAESRILEVGCGSGLTSVQLALEGYTIQAVDSVDVMIQRTRQHANKAGVGERIIASVGSVYHMRYPDNSFDLVLKIGVAPWLHSLDKALREVVRIVRPGGYLITTADNRSRLNYWLDPRYWPLLQPIRRRVRDVVVGPRGASARLHSLREFDSRLLAVGFKKIEGRTVGFGPFSFLGWKFLSDSSGVRAHRRLQEFADAGVPILRSMGTHYIVLARKAVATSAPPGS